MKLDFTVIEASRLIHKLRESQKELYETLAATGIEWEKEYHVYLELDFILNCLIKDYNSGTIYPNH